MGNIHQTYRKITKQKKAPTGKWRDYKFAVVFVYGEHRTKSINIAQNSSASQNYKHTIDDTLVTCIYIYYCQSYI